MINSEPYKKKVSPPTAADVLKATIYVKRRMTQVNIKAGRNISKSPQFFRALQHKYVMWMMSDTHTCS